MAPDPPSRSELAPTSDSAESSRHTTAFAGAWAQLRSPVPRNRRSHDTSSRPRSVPARPVFCGIVDCRNDRFCRRVGQLGGRFRGIVDSLRESPLVALLVRLDGQLREIAARVTPAPRPRSEPASTRDSAESSTPSTIRPVDTPRNSFVTRFRGIADCATTDPLCVLSQPRYTIPRNRRLRDTGSAPRSEPASTDDSAESSTASRCPPGHALDQSRQSIRRNMGTGSLIPARRGARRLGPAARSMIAPSRRLMSCPIHLAIYFRVSPSKRKS
jgi:hypothetical protein